MGDSATALWESELLRARQWLAASRTDRQHEQERLFRRVKTHIAFKDHERSLQSETAPSDDDDLALDFLADVDASSAMSALLQAEAGTQPPPVEESAMPSAADLLKPLEMPSSLASPKLKPVVKPVPMSQLDPKAVTGATLGSEAAVDNLMQDLRLEVPRSEVEETKTEESTPPHLLKSFGGGNGKEKDAAKDQAKDVHQASNGPQLKKVATAEKKKPDDIDKEMLSWVTGYRDPEVIRRKESMARRKRKHTHLYGVSSEEERQEVLMRVKEITRDSNSDSGSESEDDLSSDYSPAEDDEAPEPDEPEVVDLLSDDYLDSDEDKRPVKRKRKRLRQADAMQKKKKKPRSRKPAVTHKLTQQDAPEKTAAQAQKTPASVADAVNKSDHTPAATKGNSRQPIEVLSSGDEAGNSDQSSAPISTGSLSGRNSGAGTISDKAAGSSATKGSTILRLKIAKDVQSTPATAANAVDSSQSNDKAKDDVRAQDKASASGSSGAATGAQPPQSEKLDKPAEKVDTILQPPDGDTEMDDADLSDTGTVDLEAEDLSVENEAKTDDDEAAAGSEVPADSGIDRAQAGPVASSEGELKKAESSVSPGAESSGGADDDDVSEAETEILEDDEPETDDLGLDYSDDSDSGDNTMGGSAKKASGSKTESASSQKDSAGSKGNNAASSDQNAAGNPSDSDSKQKASDANGGDKVTASAAGVQQFFDFVPLKLKPKSKSTTSTAPKPLPVHKYDETHVKKVKNGKTSAEPKKSLHTPEKPSGGSNGLRPSKKPIATTTTMKGKYAQTRRSTKMLNPEDAPGAKPKQKNHYTMVPTQKPITVTSSNDLDDVPLAILAKELSKKPEDQPNGRYLSYAGAKKTEDAPSYAAKTPSIVPKSRFGGSGAMSSSTPAAKEPPAASAGQKSQVNGKNGYRREAQISIYDALHVEGQESASDIRDGTGYKRPSRFKKMQEEAARNGTPMVKSRLQDTDWDKVPIPKKKKKKQELSPEKPTYEASRKFSSSNERGSSKPPGKNQSKRRKKNSGPPKNSGPSYYGPQASQTATAGKYESPSRGHRGKENGNTRNSDDRRRTRSPSPPFRDRDRHSRDGRFRDDRRRRGSSRSRSRSPSPRGRDYGKDHYRRRSRSRSRSKEKASERDYRRSEQSSSNGRDRDRDASGSKRSLSPDRHSSSKSNGFSVPSDRPELGEVHQNGTLGDDGKQKTAYDMEEPPSAGALATFDDDGDNLFISDSDDDGSGLIKEVEDIRFDLESVPVDEALMAKQVYVTGFNPTVSAEQIEEDFARFGVAVDRETGFPAIRVFPCQRNHLGRGDARVTFETEGGAQEAVEELNAKNIKNSMIRVRRMDVHTMRLLTVQFDLVRDTWKCTGTQCRADVSVWMPKCDKCGRKRVFGPSNIKIEAESWLCSLCFTANEAFAASCQGCKEALPEVDRSTFYSSL